MKASERDFNRAREVVRRSGLAADLEARLREGRGGAPRRLPVEVLLAGCILVFGTRKSAALTQVHKALVKDLPPAVQFRADLRWRQRGAVRHVTIRQVRYLFARVCDLLDFSPHTAPDLSPAERIAREEYLVGKMVALFESCRPDGIPAATTVAIDATGLPTAARPSGKLPSAAGEDDYRDPHSAWVRQESASHDPDARHDYQTKTHQNGTKKLFGYQAIVGCGIYPADSRFVDLHMVQMGALVPGGYMKAAPTLRLLDAFRARGSELTGVMADRGFSHWVPEKWADELRTRGTTQVMDIHPDDHGAELDVITGALIVDGYPYAPWMPKELHRIERPVRFSLTKPTSDLDLMQRIARDMALPARTRTKARNQIEKWRRYEENTAALKDFKANIAERDKYALRPNTALRRDGRRQYKQPDYNRHLASPAQRRMKVFTQSTITLSLRKRAGKGERLEKLAKLVQELQWGSDEWIELYALRTFIEGVFGTWKSKEGEGVRRGWIRVVGIVPTSLMAAFALVHFNLRTIKKWAERAGFDNGDILLGHKPRKAAGAIDVDENPCGAIDPPVAA